MSYQHAIRSNAVHHLTRTLLQRSQLPGFMQGQGCGSHYEIAACRIVTKSSDVAQGAFGFSKRRQSNANADVQIELPKPPNISYGFKGNDARRTAQPRRLCASYWAPIVRL